MFNLKTHFEQIPLEIVRKIVEEQIRKESTAGQHQGVENDLLDDTLSETEGKSMPQSLTHIEVESLN